MFLCLAQGAICKVAQLVASRVKPNREGAEAKHEQAKIAWREGIKKKKIEGRSPKQFESEIAEFEGC